MSFHPENLEVGKKYVFCYIAWTGQKHLFVGAFVRLRIEHETLWLYFKDELAGFEVPYDVESIQEIKELQV